MGEWCPFPPLLGPLIGKLYEARDLAVFPVRAKGNMIEVRQGEERREGWREGGKSDPDAFNPLENRWAQRPTLTSSVPSLPPSLPPSPSL